MKGPIRWATLVAVMWPVVVWISGYAAVEARDAEVVQPLSEQVSCGDVLVELDKAVELAEVRDIQAKRISGSPFYRVNRFLASGRSA